jgi:hypothetical protein
MQRRTPCAFLALLLASAPLVQAQPLGPGKIPVFIAPGEVTIDGQPRPDLGRSFSDTIAGGLLATNQFTIIDSNIAPMAEPAADPFADPPEKTVAAVGPNAHYAFVPRLVVEDSYHRLTLKKVRVSDGEVVEIYEKSTDSTQRSAMFKLLDDTMKVVYADLSPRSRKPKPQRVGVIDLDPDPATTGVVVVPPKPTVQYPPPPEEKAKPEPRITEPKPVRKIPDRPIMSAPKPPPKKKPATAKRGTKPVDVTPPDPASSEPQYAGRLRSVNSTWNFCIIEAAKGVRLKKNDQLQVRSSTSLESLGTLRVSMVEGGQVIADSVDVPLESLRSGLKVYR